MAGRDARISTAAAKKRQGARRVHDAPALDLPRRDRELRLGFTVDQSHVSFAAVVPVFQSAELRDLSALVDAQIIEDQDLLAVERQFVCGGDDQRAEQPLLQLLGVVVMRVILERAGVGRSEAVRECLSRLDEALNHLCAVHRRRNPQAMPVNYRRLAQPVREFDFQRDARLRIQDGCGNLAVESVASDFAAGGNLPHDFARLHAVPDDSSDTSACERCSSIVTHAFPPRCPWGRCRIFQQYTPKERAGADRACPMKISAGSAIVPEFRGEGRP